MRVYSNKNVRNTYCSHNRQTSVGLLVQSPYIAIVEVFSNDVVAVGFAETDSTVGGRNPHIEASVP